MRSSSLSGTAADLAILGGGLAGGLLALALKQLQPDLSVLLIEAGDTLGGNHVWSFFDGDVDRDARALLEPMISHRWTNGYEVKFPAYGKILDTAYNSIRSTDFDAHLRTALANQLLFNKAVLEIDGQSLRFSDKTQIHARAILDARGFFLAAEGTGKATDGLPARDPAGPSPIRDGNAPGPAALAAGHFLQDTPSLPLDALEGGWQKFVGQRLRLSAPHGRSRPVIMDASVAQIDGYRFVYVLPMSETEIFVEDTYYSSQPTLDVEAVRGRISAYADAQGWQVEAVLHEEQGVLPVVTGGDFDRFWPPEDPLPRAGVRAGLFHPTTGYSLPYAARFALEIAALDRFDQRSLALATRTMAKRHWRSGRYYRLLDVMLFHAAAPQARYRIFEHFYRLPAALIGRFYAGQSTLVDKLRILCGRPPVPIRGAMHALLNAARR